MKEDCELVPEDRKVSKENIKAARVFSNDNIRNAGIQESLKPSPDLQPLRSSKIQFQKAGHLHTAAEDLNSSFPGSSYGLLSQSGEKRNSYAKNPVS